MHGSTIFGRVAWAAVLALLPAGPRALSPESPSRSLPEGVVVDRVVCRDDPARSYALVLPPGASSDPARKRPILYLFDARGRGALAAGLFAKAAAAHGWIVASSNDSRSDGPLDPNVTAMRSMWRDTHARFAIDERRVYAGGFSGGARVATLMATTAPGTIAGVVGCGAGFHAPPARAPDFVYYGAVGDRDFNFDEMRELDATLTRLGTAHHVEVFEGSHGWPPEDVCAAALDWFELRAQDSGTAPRDPAVAERMHGRARERGAAWERGGHLVAALDAYERGIADLRGRIDVSDLETARDRLASSDAGRRARAVERARIAADDAYRAKLTGIWAEIRSGDSMVLARLVEELEIPRLRARAQKEPGSDAALGAERLLAEIFVQTGFYLTRGYRDEKDWTRALLCLSIAAQARPASPGPWYDRAAIEAIAGRPDRAIESLNEAVARGFDDAAELAGDADFATLRGTEGYRRLVARLKPPPPPS